MPRSVILALLLILLAFPLSAAEPPLPDYAEHQDLTYVLVDGAKKPIKTRADWELRRRHILAHFQRVTGPLPRPEKPVALDVQVVSEETKGNLVYRKLSYHTDSPEQRVSAWLILPKKDVKNAAAVLCLHQTTRNGKDEPAGLGGSPNLQYAKHLAERGFVTLSPDYPGFGEYKFDFTAASGYQSGTMKAVYDNVRAVDLLQTLPEVDPERIGCIGHSLGGHNAIFTAVLEPRIKAVVSNCGFCTFLKDDVPSWTGPTYMPLIKTKFNNDAAQVPFDFTELVAACAPRAFLASAATRDSDFRVDGVQDAVAGARPVYELFDAGDRLQANYPDAPHDFPPAARDTAYEFLDRALRK